MSNNNSWKFLKQCDLKDYTVVIPSVAVGNVSQLTCDLIISSLKMSKIATMYTAAIIPIIGYDPYALDSNSLSTSCELYVCQKRKVAVVQLRAPLICKYARDFLNYVVAYFEENNVKELVILTSSFAHERKHVMTSPFRYLTNELYGPKDKLNKLKWIEHESTDGVLKIYGGGFASLLFDICREKIPCLLLYKYCSEGDNIPDAYDMIQQLCQVVPTLLNDEKDVVSQLIQPVSWKLLFGRPPPIDIY